MFLLLRSEKTGGVSLHVRHLDLAFLFFMLAAISSDPMASDSLNRNPGWPGTTLSGVPCYGESAEARFDYISERNQIGIVEKFHFYRDVERLAEPDSSLDGNLAYTLRWIPNHHRALWTRARWHMRLLKNDEKRAKLERYERLREGNPPPECYFNRAKSFNPRDGVVSSIYGVYLHKRGKYEAALTEYQRAEEMNPDYAELIYNIGLLYLDLKKFDRAREYADRARALGYPLQGLRRRLNAAAVESDGVAVESN